MYRLIVNPPEITADDFAKETNYLIYRFSEKVVKEIIYHLESADHRKQADFAYSLKKFLREAKPFNGADKESYDEIFNALLLLAGDNPVAGSILALIRKECPFEKALFEGLKALISQNNELTKRLTDRLMNQPGPQIIFPVYNLK